MEPVAMIAAAVAAGAAAGMSEVASHIVSDAYTKLKDMLFGRYGVVEAELLSVEHDPQEPLPRVLLAKELSKAGAGTDLELCSAAEELLRVIVEQVPAAAQAVGVKLTRVEAHGDIEIGDITSSGARAVEATDVLAGGSIKIHGVRAGSPDERDPSAAFG